MADASSQDFRSLLTTLTTCGGVFFLLGRTDVGKSTLMQNLIRLVTARKQSVAVIDADLGQSTYGLPTTLNLVRFSPEQEPPAPKVITSVFVGATSPVGYLLQTVVGCRRLLDRALELGVQSILIDTTGFVDGPLGVEFKLQKIELLRPTHILALTREDELAPILRACAQRDDMTVHRLPVAAAARFRSAEERRTNRQERYRRYFTNLTRQAFSLDDVVIWGRIPRRSSHDLSGLFVGLNDGQGFCRGVGLFHGRTARTIEVLVPATVVEQVKFLRFGSIAIDVEYNERFFSIRDL
jgi:polynucleotide 5'-hydroxyl-kinase GRC3/NOL9